MRAQTESKAREVISSLNPQVEGEGDFVFFDFAHHKDYYDQVCGARSITHLTRDLAEQEIVRQHYADFISRHSQDQMSRWLQKSPEMVALKTQLASQESLNSEVVELKKQLASQKSLKSEVVALKRQLAVALEKQSDDFTKQLALMKEELESLKAPKLAIPEVARGYEEIYEKFLKGVLVYRPNKGSDVGRIDLPIAALSNPLGGTFDLSNCGDTGKYLSISTGYRKGYNPDNKNKVEIWFAPWFLVDKEKSHLPTDHHMREILKTWKPEQAPIGIFWTWGGWSGVHALDYVHYLTYVKADEFGYKDLFDLAARKSRITKWPSLGLTSSFFHMLSPVATGLRGAGASDFTFHL